jgi:hypothetical protein
MFAASSLPKAKYSARTVKFSVILVKAVRVLLPQLAVGLLHIPLLVEQAGISGFGILVSGVGICCQWAKRRGFVFASMLDRPLVYAWRSFGICYPDPSIFRSGLWQFLDARRGGRNG